MRYYEEHSDVTIKTVWHKFKNFAKLEKQQINSKVEVAARSCGRASVSNSLPVNLFEANC